MASNSRGLIEAQGISDADSNCVSIEEDEVKSEIGEVTVLSTSFCNTRPFRSP